MKRFLFLVFILLCFGREVLAASPLEDFVRMGLEISQASEYQSWERQADLSLFSQPEELSRAFIEGLAQNPNEESLSRLAELLGANEASSIKAMDAIFDQVAKDPAFLTKIEAKLDWLSGRIKEQRPEAMAFTARLYEIGLLSASYIGLVYSLQGYNPSIIGYGDAFVSSPLPIVVLLVVAFRREAMAMKLGLESYLRQWSNHRNSQRFIKNLRENLRFVKSFQAVSDIAVSYEVSKSLIVETKGQVLAQKLVEELEASLQVIAEKGLLSRFINFLNSKRMRKLRNEIIKDRMLSRDSFPEDFKWRNPRKNLVPLSTYDYLRYRSHIAAWLIEHPNLGITSLAQTAQSELRSLDAKAVKNTRMRLIDKLAIESLTIGSVAIGIALAVGSTTDFAYFDSMIPDRLVDFIRNERMLVGTSVLFVPAFTLLYIEGSTVIAAMVRRRNQRQNQIAANLRGHYSNILRALRIMPTESDLAPFMRLKDANLSSLELVQALAHEKEFPMVKQCRKLF